MGLLSGLLSIPLGEEGADAEGAEGVEGLLGGLELPPFTLERDPTGRATLVVLEL